MYIIMYIIMYTYSPPLSEGRPSSEIFNLIIGRGFIPEMAPRRRIPMSPLPISDYMAIFSIGNRHFSGGILHCLCIVNGKFKNKGQIN